jgi:serine protease Do
MIINIIRTYKILRMKQTTKTLLGLGVMIASLSSGVEAVTTYNLAKFNKQNSSYDELFKQSPNANTVNETGQPVDLTEAAESAVHSVVHIKATINAKTTTVDVQNPFSDFFGDFFGNGNGGKSQQQVETPKQEGIGSGVIISSDGYIVTNNHVVANSDELSVTLNDKREFQARVIGTDATTDLALIKIQATGLPAMPIGNSDNVKIGEWVLAVGNPLNLSSTVTAGIISAKARNIGGGGVESYIQTDAAINPGNSGGALVNVKGELIGINAAIYSPTGSYAGYGFAIPVSIMKKVMEDLKKYGTVQRALLGIKGGDNSADLAKEKKLSVIDGVYISEVVDGGSASGAGLKANDVITEIDGKKIHSMAQLQEMITRMTPGTKITLTYVRDGKNHTVNITLKNSQGNTEVVKPIDMDVLGAAFRPLPADLKKQLDLKYGLQVTGVKSGKMKDAGIEKGFIILKANDQEMKSNEDMNSALKAASQNSDQVLFLTGVYPSGKKGYFAIDLSTSDSNKSTQSKK